MSPARIVSLIAAAGLLLGAGVKYPSPAGVALGTAGFMVLGAWLVIEGYHQIKNERKDKPDGP